MPTKYIYTAVPGKLKDLLQKIREIGVPERATQKWLESINSKNLNIAGSRSSEDFEIYDKTKKFLIHLFSLCEK